MIELAHILLEEQRVVLQAMANGEPVEARLEHLHKSLDYLLSWIESEFETKH